MSDTEKHKDKEKTEVEKVVKSSSKKGSPSSSEIKSHTSSTSTKTTKDEVSVGLDSAKKDTSAAVTKARSKKKSKHHQQNKEGIKDLTLMEKKLKEDLEERKELEKNLARLNQQLAALQERMYSIRFDDSVPEEQKQLELRNFANQILFCERQIALAYREAIEVFEDQLALHEIGLEGILDPIHASEVSDVELTRTGNFMRTPSTQSVQGKEPRKKWQAAFKMYKEKKDQTAVAEGQYVATRDSSLSDLDEEITKLRNGVMALRSRKNLNPRDERTLELMQEQLRVRVQQKERIARQLLTGPPQ